MPEPAESSGSPIGETGEAERTCGRCRKSFAADPHHVDGTIADWWLCDPCRAALLGDRRPALDGTEGS